MKGSEIRVGSVYLAKVSGRMVPCRVDAIRETPGYRSGSKPIRADTVYDVTNMATGRPVTFNSAAKFRAEVDPAYWPCRGGCGKRDLDANKPWTCLDCSKAGRRPFDASEVAVTGQAAPSATASSADSLEEGEQGSDPIRQSSAQGAEQSIYPTLGTTHIQNTSATTGEQEPGAVTVPAPTVMVPSDHASTSFAAAIAAATQQSSGAPVLTGEQRAILEVAQQLQAAMRGMGVPHGLRCINGQWVLVIGAGAGTGKTFTLKRLEEVLTGNGQYTAFNRSLVLESKTKFRKARCSTTHGLAFGAVGRFYEHRLPGKPGTRRIRSDELARMLGIGDVSVECGEPYPKDSKDWQVAAEGKGYVVGDDSPNPPPADFAPRPVKVLKARYLAGQVSCAVARFTQSADREVSLKHFHPIPGIDHGTDDRGRPVRTNSDRVRAALLGYARKLWADKADPKGTMPFTHDDYVKVWQLGQGDKRPVIAADYILLDEAQDTAEVFLDILRQQKHALLVMVGDDNQQIYEWRGAVNAMASFPGAPRRLLSQSFRFGQIGADVANAVLGTLEMPTDLVMRGLPSIPTRVCAVAQPRCYLYRTNAGAVGQIMRGRTEGKRGHLVGKVDDVVKFCRAAIDLQAGKGTDHPELGCFGTWAEVQEYSKEDEGADLRLMVKLIDEFGAEDIVDALDNMPDEDTADFITSTAHRSKGREWTSVKLGPDFPLSNRMTDPDRRLVYVAGTRAQEELDITECPTFCGGYDQRGGGEDGDGGEAKWVSGIEITYTVPMPTEADLAAYRAARAKGGQGLGPAAPVATGANVAAANGNRAAAASPARPAPRPTDTVVDFTWANLGNGWCVRGPVGQEGKRVTVTRKNGTTSQVTLGKVVKQIGNFWFYAV